MCLKLNSPNKAGAPPANPLRRDADRIKGLRVSRAFRSALRVSIDLLFSRFEAISTSNPGPVVVKHEAGYPKRFLDTTNVGESDYSASPVEIRPEPT